MLLLESFLSYIKSKLDTRPFFNSIKKGLKFPFIPSSFPWGEEKR
jgi:hypothetical protein